MLIVAVSDKGKVRDNTLIDLRVEDSPEPLAELERLLLIEKAYHHADLGDLAVEKGDIEAAKIEYAMAEALQPQNVELMFWKAVSLLNAGMTHDAVPIFRDVFAAEENWRELLRRLPAAGIAEKNNVQLLFKHLPDSANRQRG